MGLALFTLTILLPRFEQLLGQPLTFAAPAQCFQRVRWYWHNADHLTVIQPDECIPFLDLIALAYLRWNDSVPASRDF